MDKDKLSARESALIAAARREAEARKGAPVPPQAAAAPRAAPAPRPPMTPAQPVIAEKPKPSAAERIAQLMAEERAENERRKKKIRRYGIIIPSAVIALAALWALHVSRRR